MTIKIKTIAPGEYEIFKDGTLVGEAFFSREYNCQSHILDLRTGKVREGTSEPGAFARIKERDGWCDCWSYAADFKRDLKDIFA